MLPFLKSKNKILTIHDVRSFFGESKLKNYIIKLFWFYLPFKSVKLIHVISNFTKNELIEKFNLKNEIKVIHNPIVSTSTSDMLKDLKKIILIGTKPNKNLDYTLKSLTQGDFDINVVGRLSNEQKEIVINNNLKVTEHFNIDEDELNELYSTSGFFILLRN